jgi:hypothetical protein
MTDEPKIITLAGKSTEAVVANPLRSGPPAEIHRKVMGLTKIAYYFYHLANTR